MKFALTNSAVDQKDLPALAERCRALGFDGIDCDYSPASPTEVRQIFTDAAIQISSIAAAAQFTQDSRIDLQAANALRAALDTAGHLGCHLVKIPDAAPVKRQSIMDTISAMADWLKPLADAAADRGISILVENGSTLATARPLWMLMERVDHPAVGICWNVDSTLAAGERLAVTVPTLNSRIRYVRISNRDVSETITRLRGIGYGGWVSFTGPLADAEQFLLAIRAVK